MSATVIRNIANELNSLPIDKKINAPLELVRPLLPVITKLVLASLCSPVKPARLHIDGKLEIVVRLEDEYGQPLFEAKITPVEIDVKMSDKFREAIGHIAKEILAELGKPIKEDKKY